MNAVTELRNSYILLMIGVVSYQTCIDWAVERLLSNEAGNDHDIELLAEATEPEVLPLVEKIIERYLGKDSLDKQLAAGKYIASLYGAYRTGKETVVSLDEKIDKLYVDLSYPDWLIILHRNCEYATDVLYFLKPFEEEFEYISNLWLNSQSLDEFEARYSRDISNQHMF